MRVQVKDGLYRVRVKLGQSNLLIVSDRAEAVSAALTELTLRKAELEAYVAQNPFYRYSLEPVQVESWAPRAVRLAARAAEVAGVGPMAAVPGALAELAVEAMAEVEAKVGVVEDGGEIAAFSSRPLTVAVYAGASPLSGRLGFHLEPGDFPLGIATSSATVSHAVNFGRADAAVVLADSPALADAAAKAVCNAVTGENIEASIEAGLRRAREIPGVRGALVVRGDRVGFTGRLPRLASLKGGPSDVLRAALHIEV